MDTATFLHSSNSMIEILIAMEHMRLKTSAKNRNIFWKTGMCGAIFPQNFGTLIRSAYYAKKSCYGHTTPLWLCTLKLTTKHVGTHAPMSKDRLSPFNERQTVEISYDYIFFIILVLSVDNRSLCAIRFYHRTLQWNI